MYQDTLTRMDEFDIIVINNRKLRVGVNLLIGEDGPSSMTEVRQDQINLTHEKKKNRLYKTTYTYEIYMTKNYT